MATGPEDYAAVPDGHGRLRASRAGDLPDGLTAVPRPRGAGQGMARLRESNAAKAGVFAALVAGVVLVAAIGNSESPLQVLATVLLLSPVWMLALAGLLLLHSRLEKRAEAARRAEPPQLSQDCQSPNP